MTNGLQLELSLNRTDFELGKPIRVAMCVTNTSDDVKTLRFGSAQKLELIVIKSGKEIWRLSNGMMFPMVIQVEELGPGETLALPGTWRQVNNAGNQVEPGEYQIKGILMISAEKKPETEPITIYIKNPNPN